ncbi:hypothetical protein B4O97_17025 [Marispirochaeta aestuarii]|uniref:Nucleoside diphosphate kinase-like domain-containing protein n=1 Tax=Marispirochaeta aestuarii TaxID=1963862 RepID=A0A1Y1RTV3_9SPIO|nr:hypothetical protein [Marispirochaeta aestuarii]ORC31216.1 hypothetical protein B4O97_17025 [Marispirochaeta aestuarii]
MTNNALVFIKPQAITARAIAFVEEQLGKAGVSFSEAGEIEAAVLKEKRIIDRHYASISRAAMDLSPRDLRIPEKGREEFFRIFHRSIDQVLAAGELLNCTEAFEILGNPSAQTLNTLWRNGIEVKLGPGLYVSRMEKSDLFVINGFYPSMKELFVAPGLKVRLYDAGFDPDDLSWKDFRRLVIGATNPEKAAPGSLRRLLRDRYKNLDLEEQPRTAFNGIHASAGPIEGLREFQVWLDRDPAEHELGEALLKGGMSPRDLRGLMENAPARFQDTEGPVFDITEDVDARDLPGNIRLLA